MAKEIVHGEGVFLSFLRFEFYKTAIYIYRGEYFRFSRPNPTRIKEKLKLYECYEQKQDDMIIKV